MRALPLLLSLFPLALPAAAASVCTGHSGAGRTDLLELYTSEGCSSCPPAERWLSHLAGTGIDARRVVPLAFHVDYWDSLGWPDPFAQAVFSARQRQRNGRLGWVYTPQFMLNGDDFRADASRLHQPPPLAQAALGLALDQRDPRAWDVQLEASLAVATPRHQAYVALYENRLSSRVNAGENAQRTLRHDYVVRELDGPFSVAADGHLQQRLRFALKSGWKPQDMGVAAFVQAPDGAAIQALALPACR